MGKIKELYHFLSPKFQNLFSEYKVDFKPRFGHGKPAHPQLGEIIDNQRGSYAELLHGFVKNKEVFHSIKKTIDETNEDNPTWNNQFLPGLDIVALYSIIGLKKPETYIEIGSGNSTKVARKAINDFGLKTKIISVDPYPRANIDHLADQVIRQPVENLSDHGIFNNLKENDILFIDNSHRALPNSDVTVSFLEIMPGLKKGVLVHVHDIYLPYDYPQFMCDRFYSEQYVLAAFILANRENYKPFFPAYFVSEDKELKEILAPVWEHPVMADVEKHGGSFWLQIGG
jgi:hypothetical protein